jgi:tryptophanyl-tRNA synthetase
MKLVSDASVIQHFEDAYSNCSIRYGDMKKQLAEDMIRFITPIREKASAIKSDTIYLEKVMKEGAEKANLSATKTMSLVREAMGLKYY